MADTFKISTQQARVLAGTVAVAFFFFLFLYFSLSYPVLVLLSELFFAIVATNMLNRAFSKRQGLFQNETAIYMELILAVVIVLIFNQLGITVATFSIFTIVVLFAIFFLMFYVASFLGWLPSGAGGKKAETKTKNEQIIVYYKQPRGGRSIIERFLWTGITLVEFLVIFFVAITYPFLTIGSILFISFTISALVTGNNLDTKKELAFLLVSVLIIFGIQQLALYNYIPQVNTPQALLNFNSAVIVGVLIFIFYYAFARIGLVKGEQTSTFTVGK